MYIICVYYNNLKHVLRIRTTTAAFVVVPQTLVSHRDPAVRYMCTIATQSFSGFHKF